MYERFTDRARKAMQLANMEAQRYNHAFVGTEHILLGIVKCEDCIANEILHRHGADLVALRKKIEAVVSPGPDMITMGRLPLTPRAKHAIESTVEAAQKLGDHFVGTEHMLLGLLADPECIAAFVLGRFGMTAAGVHGKAKEILARLANDARMGVDVATVVVKGEAARTVAMAGWVVRGSTWW